MRILISGASGFIGTRLRDHLRATGHDVEVVRRGGEGAVSFYPDKGVMNPREIAGIDVAICLNGAGLGARRWTRAYRKTLLTSRLTPVRTWVDTFARMPEGDRPRHFITASAVGIYGDRGDETLTEASATGTGFLADLCRRWERHGSMASDLGVAHTALRTGLVMDGGGGMLGLLKHLYRLGLGGRLSTGNQWMSTISLTDHVRAITHIINQCLTGPVNLTGPQPVRNREWTRALADHLGRPAIATVPRWAMKAALGDFADEAALASQRVLPARLTDSGFTFTAPTVGEILDDALPA